MIVMKREIETPRLVLRPWSDDDLDHLARILANPQVVRYITHEYGPLSRKEATQAHDRILRLWNERGFGPWAAIEKESGRWVGKIGLNVLENWPGPHNVEVEWQLEPSVWGRGLATEGGQAGVQYGFDKLSLNRIISVTVPQNVASWRVMEKCGLSYQGTIQLTGRLTKRTRDVVWYAIDRSTWELRNKSTTGADGGQASRDS